ncbi:CDGSH iron-sulfur domain-containing protein [Streptomyces sp. NPDC008313]|uniref:CDGSH iron-sulfur domain-containing protein n=1 Tax=Streptomyces sp. NPDC008313 TaxID=3364826 RepID=UPI0036ECF82D
MPNTPERPRRVRVDPDGPLLVEGPVEVVGDDGSVTVSHRFTVAICTCRRSRTYPWCDTSHRRRAKPRAGTDDGPPGTARGARENEEDTPKAKGAE